MNSIDSNEDVPIGASSRLREDFDFAPESLYLSDSDFSVKFRKGNAKKPLYSTRLFFTDFIDKKLATKIYFIHQKHKIDHDNFMDNTNFATAKDFMNGLKLEEFKEAASVHHLLEKLYLVYYGAYSKKIHLENKDIGIIYNLICKNQDIDNEKLIKLFEDAKKPYSLDHLDQTELERLIKFSSILDNGFSILCKINDLGIEIRKIYDLSCDLGWIFIYNPHWDRSMEKDCITELYQYMIANQVSDANYDKETIYQAVYDRVYFTQEILPLITEQSVIKDVYKSLTCNPRTLEALIASRQGNEISMLIDRFVHAFLFDDAAQLDALRALILGKETLDAKLTNEIIDEIATEAKKLFDVVWMQYDRNHDVKDDNHDCIKKSANFFAKYSKIYPNEMHKLFEAAHSFKNGFALIARLDSLEFTFQDIYKIITIKGMPISSFLSRHFSEKAKHSVINELFLYVSNIDNKADLNVNQIIEIAYKNHYFNTYIKPLVNDNVHNINKIYQSLSIKELAQLKTILAAHADREGLLQELHQFIKDYPSCDQSTITDLIYNGTSIFFKSTVRGLIKSIKTASQKYINVDKNAELKTTEIQPTEELTENAKETEEAQEKIQEDANIDGSSTNSNLDSQLNLDFYFL